MKKTHDAVATIGEWTDPESGRKVKRTLPIGAVFESSRGNLVLKLDAVPVSAEWSGWVALKPCAPALPPGRRMPPGMPAAPSTPPAESPEDDEAPF
jgi:hypothetical protein